MKQREPILRWRDRPPGGDAPEDRAATLIRGSLAPGEPDELHLARIQQRSRRRSRSYLVPRLAFTALFLVVGAATVMAARRAGWLDRILPALSPAPVRPQRPRQPARVALAAPAVVIDSKPPEAREAAAPSPAPAEAAPASPAAVTEVKPLGGTEARLPRPAEAKPAAENLAPRRHARIFRRTASVESREPPTTNPSDEIRALDQAIGLLRRDRNAGAALSSLDAYLGRYPHGVLNREARLARVDALLTLQRLDEAQNALDPLSFDTHRRETELQVIRGELRARSNCARAEEDYTAVLARSLDVALVERALYGRGACRAKRGDGAGASKDLRRYLERFPDGAHAGWARQWLESAGQSFKKGG